jgi:hypothetical protein
MKTVIKIQDKLQTVQSLLGKPGGKRQLKNIILKQFLQQFLNGLKTSDTNGNPIPWIRSFFGPLVS